MDSVLIVSSSEKGNEGIAELFRSSDYERIAFSSDGSEARRTVLEYDYDLVVINTPLSDEFGNELALSCINHSSTDVIMLVKAENAEEVASRMQNFGVFVFEKPINKRYFLQFLSIVETARKRLLVLRSENVKLLNKIEETRLIDRAKCVLIQYLNLTEAQAHRYIEKQAMDLRISKIKVARAILNTYES